MGKKSEAKIQAAASANDSNAVVISGTAIRVKQMEKLCRFTLDVATPTPKGNVSHAYVPVVWFNEDSEDTVTEKEHIAVNGALRSGSYENKDGQKIYTLDVVAEKVIFS